jgi:Tfp pilus assembly protein PilV
MALLEVMVALVILGAAGSGLVAALGAALRSEDQLSRREATLVAADRVLTAMTLLSGSDLDQRIGHHELYEFVVSVQRPQRTLYRIAVSEAVSPDVEMLVTVVYRPDPASP